MGNDQASCTMSQSRSARSRLVTIRPGTPCPGPCNRPRRRPPRATKADPEQRAARRKSEHRAAVASRPGRLATTGDDAASPGNNVITRRQRHGPGVPIGAAAFACVLGAPRPRTSPYLDVFRHQKTALRSHHIPLRENQRSSTDRLLTLDRQSVTRRQSPIDRCRMPHAASTKSYPPPSSSYSRVTTERPMRRCAALTTE